MSDIESLRLELANEIISVQEVQRKLPAHLYSAADALDGHINFSKIESAVKALDNDLELIIFTVKEENHKEATMAVLDKAQQLLSSGFEP